eukprot:4798438-Prorocentrum_lima.AAC.1
MRQEHRDRILRALALETAPRAVTQVDSIRWTAFPRRRLLISTLPAPEQPWRPAPRPIPWEG